MNKYILVFLCAIVVLNINASSPKLGGGYKGIKWGVTRKELINLIKMKPISANDNFLKFENEKKTLECSFYKNRFYRITILPGLEEGDEQGAKAVLSSLNDKYGEGKQLLDFIDTSMIAMPLLMFEWNDGETRIRFSMWDYFTAAQKYSSSYATLPYPSSTIWVEYISIKIYSEKENDEKKSKEKKEMEGINKKKKQFKNDF